MTVNIDDINGFFVKAFGGKDIQIPKLVKANPGEVWIEYLPGELDMRPGDFISGPTQMRLADHAAFVALFTLKGVTPMAMTSNLNIDFLRPAQGEVLKAHCRTLKMGRKLGVFTISQYTDNPHKPVSFSTVSYVMPD